MQNFNVRFASQVESWSEKYRNARANTSSLNSDNLLIVVDFVQDIEKLIKQLKEALRLYNRELVNYKKVKLIIQDHTNLTQKELSKLYKYLNKKDLILINIDESITDKEKANIYNKKVADIAKGANGETYGTIFELSSPESMYSNLLDYINNGILPLNFSIPIEEDNPNIFKEISENLLKKISGIEFNWFLNNHPDRHEFWTDKYKLAVRNMKKAKANKNTAPKILIECAAQHPLKDGIYPGDEFKARLDKAISIYLEKKKLGYDAKIYIPGSLHQIRENKNGKEELKVDKCSLSRAGELYLESHNIPEEDILGEKINKEIMPSGLYNSADECRVASEIFKSQDFNELISVTSPGQLYRVALFYLNFGVIPSMYTAPTKESYHDVIKEITNSIPLVMIHSPSWQLRSNYSEATEIDNNIAIKSRYERNPVLNLLKEPSSNRTL